VADLSFDEPEGPWSCDQCGADVDDEDDLEFVSPGF
jgi:hypothetical protein